jgi:hypothetical protein
MSDQWQTLRGRYRRPSLNGNRRCMRTILTAAAVPGAFRRGPLNIERKTRLGNVGRSPPRIQLWQLQLFDHPVHVGENVPPDSQDLGATMAPTPSLGQT